MQRPGKIAPPFPRIPRSAGADRALALIAGINAATGFQPLGLWPATLASLAVLMALVERARGWRGAVALGWLFGLGHFTLGNNWIATAFTYQAQMPAWLGWIAVVLLSLYLALYPALAALGGWWLARRWKAAFVPAFAACWIVAEGLRGWAFTGFPWNPLGVVALGGFDRPGLARLAPWMGTYALSGLVVLLAGYWLFAGRAFGLRRWIAGAAYVAVPVALFLLPLHGDERAGTLAYTLVQPNVGQDTINDTSLYEQQFETTAGLSLSANPALRRVVLWPESGVPDYLRDGYDPGWYAGTTYGGDPALARARIGRVIGPQSLLLTGAVDLAVQGEHATGAYNVVTAIDGAGTIRGGYAKAHLVPYGEYLPMRELLTPLGLSRLVAGELDYIAGPGPRTIDFGAWGKAGMQICYEIVFSGHVVDPAHRPDYIFNPSNDGWFGAWGPPQHLAQARLRAIEEGVPILRSTTNGISAVIDADGGVRQAIPRHVAGRIDGTIPPAHAPTLFARTGNLLGLGWSIGLLLLALVASRRRAR